MRPRQLLREITQLDETCVDVKKLIEANSITEEVLELHLHVIHLALKDVRDALKSPEIVNNCTKALSYADLFRAYLAVRYSARQTAIAAKEMLDRKAPALV